ncbi:hypothetical protein [Streptomyces soliscabiei]|uniref:hypothetical protein n=1 Tax=Streptomyces soliscabiei TaxID=588897 RepID=UPI003FA37A6C
MVLQETDQASLVGEVGAEMGADGVGVLVQQAVAQPLVVAVVEALLLKEAGPARSPQIFAKTSFISSIAMSQRTPSAWSPIADRRSPIADRRSPPGCPRSPRAGVR